MSERRNGILIDDATLTNTGGTATLGSILGDTANSSIVTRLGILQNNLGVSYNSSRYLAVTADMSSLTWNAAATQEVFTVTGAVRMRMWIECTATLEDAGDAADICFGYAGDTDAFIATTGAAGKGGVTITAGQLWYDASPAAAPDTFGNSLMDYVIPNGQDVGYEITGAALTAGTLVFHCVWEPLNATGAVVAGTGTTL